MPKVLQACHWLPQTFIVERKHMALCTHKIMHNRETAVQNTWWSGTVDRKWKIDQQMSILSQKMSVSSLKSLMW